MKAILVWVVAYGVIIKFVFILKLTETEILLDFYEGFQSNWINTQSSELEAKRM